MCQALYKMLYTYYLIKYALKFHEIDAFFFFSSGYHEAAEAKIAHRVTGRWP